jgi:hypothetical protein
MYNYYLRRHALEEQEVRRNRKSTYNEPLQEAPDLEEFLIQFSNTIYTHERRLFYIQEQTKYPRLRSHFDMLVPAIISYEDFWRRYEYRTDIKRIMRELRVLETNETNETNNQSWTESVWKMTQSFRKLMPEETDEPLEHNISNQRSEAEIGEKAPVEEGEEIFLTEDDYEEEQVISTEDGIGEEVLLQQTALKMNIHIYPEGINDEDRVEELEEHGDEDDADRVEELEEHGDEDKAESEFESEEEEEADDVNGDNSVDEPVSNIYVYPEMIDVDNEAIQSNRVKEDAKIHDDEYGSIDDEKKADHEYGSLGSVDPQTFVTEIDDEILPMDDTYYDDNLGKEENCECACIIS